MYRHQGIIRSSCQPCFPGAKTHITTSASVLKHFRLSFVAFQVSFLFEIRLTEATRSRVLQMAAWDKVFADSPLSPLSELYPFGATPLGLPF